MFNWQEYRKFLILGCLTMVITITPTIAGALPPGSSLTTSSKIAQNSTASTSRDEGEIKKVLIADAKEQNWQVKIGAITIVDGYALATTSDENTGGESVLKKHQGVWQIIGGTGGAFSQPEELVEFGKVPLSTARRLLKVRASQRR